MKRHKMSLDTGYCSDWTVQDALRELLQNARDWANWTPVIDQNLEKTSWTVCLISHNAKLEPVSLLMGHSRKEGDNNVGRHGEGYKVAMLVLTRLGYKSYVTNHNEVWRPKLIDSRTYKTKQLVFDIETIADMSYGSVYFTVEGLTSEDIDEFRRRSLELQPAEVVLETRYGDVVRRPGDIFVGGLWVCNMKEYQFGYDFKPSCMKLDRDRRVVRDFDVSWLTSQMWHSSEDFELVLSMIEGKKPDVQYLDSFMCNSKIGLADAAANAFVSEHGPEAVPVTNQSALEDAQREGHAKIVLVPESQYSLIDRSSNYCRPAPKVARQTPREILIDFQRFYGDDLGLTGQGELDRIIELAINWSN